MEQAPRGAVADWNAHPSAAVKNLPSGPLRKLVWRAPMGTSPCVRGKPNVLLWHPNEVGLHRDGGEVLKPPVESVVLVFLPGLSPTATMWTCPGRISI
jgi:hypothetical protein